MESSSLPEAVKESQKRRRERLLIILILLLVWSSPPWRCTWCARGAAGHRSLLAFSLLNINTSCSFSSPFSFSAICQALLERRRRVFGSRLRTRLVLTFISLTLPHHVPLFYGLAVNLQPGGLLLGRQVEWQLDQALDQRKAFSQVWRKNCGLTAASSAWNWKDGHECG